MLGGCSVRSSQDNPEALFNNIKTEARGKDFQHAQLDAKLAYETWISKPETVWYWKFKLLYADTLLFGGQTSAAKDLLEVAPPQRYKTLSLRYKYLLGYVADRLQPPAEAEAILRPAAEEARSSQDFEVEADIDLLWVDVVQDPAMREQLLSHVLTIAREKGLLFQAAAADLDFGYLRFHQSRFAEAIPYLQQASEFAKQIGATHLYYAALGNMATCYYNVGQFDRASILRQETIDSQVKLGLKTWLRDSYLDLGSGQLLQGDNANALDSFRRASALVSEKDSPRGYAQVLSKLASALESTGATEEAENLNRKAAEALDGTDPETKAAVLLTEGSIAERRGNLEDAKERYTEAIRLSAHTKSLLWSGQADLALLNARAGNVNAARKNFEDTLLTINSSRADQLRSEYQITFLSRLIVFYQKYVDLLVAQDDEHALEIADSSRAAVLTQNLLGGKTVTQRKLVPKLKDIARRSGSTFLYYWLAPKHSYLWVINSGGLKTIPLGDGPEIEASVKGYRNLLENDKIDPITTGAPSAARLFSILVKPALSFIEKNTQVVIVPDGALHNLNFETLIVEDPNPHYWLQDATISIAPSLGALMGATPSSKSPPRSLLLFGDPDTTGTEFRNLQYAADEMKCVRRHFPEEATTVKHGMNAVPSAYRAAHPDRYSDVMFVAHAEANEYSPLDSSIILSKEKDKDVFRLNAAEIMEVPLRADLVTISACHGAGAQTLSGEGLVGFAWAFFHAGARNVLAGLWDVNDRSTSELMDSFYRHAGEGLSYAAALRQAKLDMLKTQFKRPYYWAPFQLYTRELHFKK